jgi:phage terminase large subunit-like protein
MSGVSTNSSAQVSLFNLQKEVGELCSCGCGGLASPGRKFIWGHHMRGRGRVQLALKKGKPDSRVRAFTSTEKNLLAHRLSFPEREEGEHLGDYLFRKFLFFCENYVCHVSGEYGGLKVRLMRWQANIFERLFSTLDSTGKRRYRWLHIFIARKNGKTFLVCLLLLYWLSELSFEDPGAEIYACAATKEQASKIIFKTARMMVEKSPELSQLIKIGRMPAHLTNRLSGGFFEPLSADGPKQLGRNTSLAIFDEAHTQPNDELWNSLATSQGMRSEPLFVSISTAGPSRSCFYYSVYEKMKEIQKNPDIDQSTLVALFEADENMDWRSPENFLRANPSLGIEGEIGFRSREEIESVRKAALEGEGEAAYKQFYLNLWSSYGRRNFLPVDKWNALEVPNIDDSLLKESQVWAGLDLSLTTALSALALLFSPNPNFPKWACYVWSWLAGIDLLECERRDHLPYSRWQRDEFLFFDGSLTINVDSILQVLKNLKSGFPRLEVVGFDPYGAAQIQHWDRYFNLEPVPQQYSHLSPGIKSLQVKILNLDILHEPNPLMASMIEAARVISDPNGNLRLDKAKSYSRIDGVSALVNAEVLALKHYIKPKGGK